ncbi:MAG: CbiX/SirB N-terminal domain-containing protein [Sandaracinaceae bacterium]|nr:CbiX/SirB N-terminal domain-containing protein [Sandaracinaceae bacterium]
MRALVLVDHGSRSPDAARATETVAGAVRERLGPSWQVRVAHLELEPPHPPEVIDACVAQGASDIVIHPYFLAPGRHASEDMARVVEQARARHPSVRFVLTDPLGPDPVLADLVLARAGLRARFVVVRQDDHGTRFDVSVHATEAGAEQERAALEARSHKQMYWVERRWTSD